MTQPQRVNYFERQFLRLPDFQDEQAYHIAARRRHNLSHHSWGIVTGLDLILDADGRAVILPGMAVDGYGRELVLIARKVVGRDVFDRYATTRLDLWVEYQLELFDDVSAPVECGPEGDARNRYRAAEKARVSFTRAGAARVEGRKPEVVPVEDLDAFPPELPDDPRRRWPVYLGRVVMELDTSGSATFTLDVRDRVYAGLIAETIDHPGNPSRIELGRVSEQTEERAVGGVTYLYGAPSPRRDFAVFTPPTLPKPLVEPVSVEPVIAVEPGGTQILGSTVVHGNIVLDGTAMEFPLAMDVTGGSPSTSPSIYRGTDLTTDELRIDAGDANEKNRKIVIGLTKEGTFQPALTIDFSLPTPQVTVHGDLYLNGELFAKDIRMRTLKEDVIPQLAAMFNLGML
jgi:hypothetical protein